MRALTTVLLLGLLVNTNTCGSDFDCTKGWSELEFVEHDSSADLFDARVLYPFIVAVGTEGTVLRINRDPVSGSLQVYDESTIEPETTLRAIGDLYGVWWIVGDDGLVVYSDDDGQSWTRVDLGTDASLHAIHDDVGNGNLVIIGDEVVYVIEEGADPSGQAEALGNHRLAARVQAKIALKVAPSACERSVPLARQPRDVAQIT